MIKFGRAILAGWATLLAIAYVVERPLVLWSAPLIGARWIATVELALDCAAMAAAGFVAGRLHRSHAILTAAIFAFTLCFWDFGGTLALNVPLLARLIWDTLHDRQFFDALIASAETTAFLFGCLMMGAALSRAREKPLSIVE